MRAVIIRQGELVVEELPVPEPGEGEVLVKTIACGICGSDLHLLKNGQDIMETVRNLGAEPDSLDDGLVMGHEYVAEVVSYGPGCHQEIAVGSRVCSVPFLLKDGVPVSIGASTQTTGAYGEYFLLTESMLIPVPDGLPTENAALTEPLAIALHAVNQSERVPEGTAVVIGCGPIGLAIVAFLKRNGVERIIASDPSFGRRELAGVFGAVETINPLEADLWSLVSPSEPVVVFECSGRPGMIADVVVRAPIKTELIVTGICPGEDNFIPMLAVSKELVFRFVSFYDASEFAEALSILASGDIEWTQLVTGKVGFDDVPAAFERLSTSDKDAKILIAPEV